VTRAGAGWLLAAALLSSGGCAHYDDAPAGDTPAQESSMFKFSGKRPGDLGAKNGKFTAARTWKPNWVSSQVEVDDKHHVAPLPGTITQVAKVIKAMPRVVVVTEKPDYIHAEFSTPLMGYTDDVEFIADGGGVHVRSSSRLGIRDFDVNRKRVETIRAALGG
jgi:uncharacterized protein (DUF1499 family)